MFCDLIECLDTKALRGAVKEFLTQSRMACEAGDVSLMSDLAGSARRVAVECSDTMGEAAALVHLGAAWLAAGRPQRAGRAFDWARRIFHRDPGWRQRFNEGVASFGLGWVYQLSDPPHPIKAIAHFQQAKELLQGVRENYWTAADDQKVREIDGLVREIESRIAAHMPRVYVDAEALSSGPLLNPSVSDEPSDDDLALFAQDKDAAWTGEFRRDAPGDIESVDLES